jgi:hypothetical protein
MRSVHNRFGAAERVRQGEIYPFDVDALSDAAYGQPHVADKLDIASRG